MRCRCGSRRSGVYASAGRSHRTVGMTAPIVPSSCRSEPGGGPREPAGAVPHGDRAGEDFDDAAAVALAAAGLVELENLSVPNTVLSDAGMRALADAGTLSSLRGFAHSWRQPPDRLQSSATLGVIARRFSRARGTG
jgi:hypothetical protein